MKPTGPGGLVKFTVAYCQTTTVNYMHSKLLQLKIIVCCHTQAYISVVYKVSIEYSILLQFSVTVVCAVIYCKSENYCNILPYTNSILLLHIQYAKIMVSYWRLVLLLFLQ